MPASKCKICEIRKPRRYCPGVTGDICSICCGTEREMTVHCPLDCLYLQEAHSHEKLEELLPGKMPSADVRLTERFLEDNQEVLAILGVMLLDAAMAEEAIDADMREALDAAVRTYRTLESGLYYESRPDNPIAARIQSRIRDGVDSLHKTIAEQGGPPIRDSTLQALLVFFQRLAAQWDNHRRYGRSFIDFLRRAAPPPPPLSADAPLLIQPA